MGRRVWFAEDSRCDEEGFEALPLSMPLERGSRLPAYERATSFSSATPGRAGSEICETVQLVRRTRPDDIGVSLSYPLPGTGFFERVQAQLGRKRNWIDSDDLCTIHIASYNDNFYHALRDALHAEVAASHAPSGSSDPSTCESLWRRVYELEPVCRNRNVLSLPPETSHRSTQSTFLPLEGLFAEARRS